MSEVSFVSRDPSPEPEGHITATADAGGPSAANDPSSALLTLHQFLAAQGDISHLLSEDELVEIGDKAVREWRIDCGSRDDWKEDAERFLDIAAQTGREDDEREPIWEDGADIHYPLLTVACQQFAARAYPELVKGDQVAGVKVFTPPQMQPQQQPQAQQLPMPNAPPQVLQLMQLQQQQMAQQAAQAQAQQSAFEEARNARAQRVKHYLNYCIFYKMDNWEGETDALLHELPNLGSDFKKVYFGEKGLQSDFLSSLRVTVHNQTKSLARCPRITQDFEVYPYEIEDRMRGGVYRRVDLPMPHGEDEQKPRKFIEQHRLEDLDGDGLAEPYAVTVDEETRQVLRVEPAFTLDDVMVDPQTGAVMRIERWLPYAEFTFLPDPKGQYYGIGFGRLLESIMDTVDASLNQLIDAGTAEIAGGGFIADGVRLQGSGQGGVLDFRPGEYAVVSAPGNDLRNAIWERTVPHPSAVTMQLLELLLAAAKDIASVKDVITGEAPSTAPVGTTLALQNQALQVFSSIYKRIYRGFRDEFRLMYRAIQRWATDQDRQEYQELTGGDLDQDFSGDGTDIQPAADPSVVTKMQKVARLQTLMQIAESPVGQAAGMLQPGPAQSMVKDLLDDLDVENPQRFVADVPPNPMALAEVAEKQAKAQDLAANAQLKTADVVLRGQQGAKDEAETTHKQVETLHKLGEVAKGTHELRQEADRIAQQGSVANNEQLAEPETEIANA